MAVIAAFSDPEDLRSYILDVAALSALPDAWNSSDPHQIAHSVAAALVTMLDSDFVHITLRGRRDEQTIEVTRTGDRIAAATKGIIRATLRDGMLRRSSDQTAEIPNPYGEGILRIASVPVGLGDGVVVAGSNRPNFPNEAQRLLIGMGAKEVALAVDRWHAETDELRFAALVERSSDFIGLASLDGRPRYLNPAGLKLVGLDALEEACRLHVLDFVVPEERARVRDGFWPVVLREGRWAGEINFRHFETGAKIPVLVDGFRIDDPRTGHPIDIATVGRDLTAHKQAEAELRHLNAMLEQRVARRTTEAAKANRKLVMEIEERERTDARLQELQSELSRAGRLSTAGQMAAALAHELNQPLTALTTSVNAARRLLAKGGPEMIDSAREVMNEVAEDVLRAGEIIRRLRDLASRGETEKRVESVVTMVEEASALALSDAEGLGVELRFRFDPKASNALADRIQIQQVLVNLMRNALEAMAGQERRELTVTTALLDQDTVEIAVTDNGPGISKESIGHLFEPFVSNKLNGMGLGLSICGSIVEAHGGQIRAEANPAGGMTFRFTLAAAPGTEVYDAD